MSPVTIKPHANLTKEERSVMKFWFKRVAEKIKKNEKEENEDCAKNSTQCFISKESIPIVVSLGGHPLD